MLLHCHYHYPNQANIIPTLTTAVNTGFSTPNLVPFNSFSTLFLESNMSLFFLKYVNRFPVCFRLISDSEIAYQALHDLISPSPTSSPDTLPSHSMLYDRTFWNAVPPTTSPFLFIGQTIIHPPGLSLNIIF